jgi:pimeloyl-ACP methyl ester carboxylesterase
MRDWIKRRPKLSIFLGVLVVLLLALVLMASKPFSIDETLSPDPAQSYTEAVSRIETIQAQEGGMADLHPLCETRLLTHGDETEQVIVFIHGFTSCPDQFAQIGQAYFEAGYNVYIPREPHHGIADKLGNPLLNYTAEEMAAFASQTADIAQGLGERVTVVGLSGGGTMATWMAQERADVDLAVPIAPFLGIGFLPRVLNRPLTNLMLLVPNFFQWWDPIKKADNPFSAPYSYTRYPTHALFETLRLGFAVERDSKHQRPAAGSILVITNANDESVNNDVVAEFEQLWHQHGEEFLQTFQFDKSLGLPHDLITPTRPGGDIEAVYPKLEELIPLMRSDTDS